MARGRKDSEESTSSDDSETRSSIDSESSSGQSRSRDKSKREKKSSKRKHKKSSRERRKKKRHRSTNSERSRSRDKKKKRKESLDSRESKRSKKPARSRSRSKKRRHSSRLSPPRRSRSRDRRRSPKRSPKRSPEKRPRRSREKFRSRSSRSRSRNRHRRTSSYSNSRRSPQRRRSPTINVKTFAPKIDLSALKILPGGSTYKPELNEEQQIQQELNNFKSKTETDVDTPRKRKPTFQDFFGDGESDGSGDDEDQSSKRLAGLGGFRFNGVKSSSNGDALWKAVVPPATPAGPGPGPPKLTRAPTMIQAHPSTSKMPDLTPMPGIIPVDIKEEPLNEHARVVKDEKDHSDGMDISDSDEYDEDEKKLINDSVAWDYNKPELDLPVKREPPPLVSRPSPPRLKRKSRFSAAPIDIDPPKLEPAPKLEPPPHTESSSPPNLEPEEPLRSRSPSPPPIPKFTLLKEPQYHCNKDFVRAGKDTRKMDCDCPVPEDPHEIACGDDCLNRQLMVECSNRCKCAERCTNKNFQKRKYADIEAFWAKGKGHGLKAKSRIGRGDFVIEYLGEVVSAKEFKKRSHEYARSGKVHHYFMELTRQATIDAYQKGAISRFINHSCEPNAETQKWTVNGLLRIGFFALREIESGEEITFDYQFIHFGKGQKCLCGAPSCRGVIGREAGVTEYRRKAGMKEEDENYGKLILNTKRVDGTEDMQKLATNMSRTASSEIKARIKAMDLIVNSSRKLQSVFISNFGLQILWSYAKEDHLDHNALKEHLMRLLYELEIAHRDKVEDTGLISIVDKWSRTPDEHQDKSVALLQKWKKLSRRIPMKKPVKRSTSKDDSKESSPAPQMPTLMHKDSMPHRRRSPRLAREQPERDPELRAKMRTEHRRRFEAEVERQKEVDEQLREIAKQNVDRIVEEAMDEEDENEYESYDHDSPLGPRTPPESPTAHETELLSDDPADWPPDKQRVMLRRILENLKPSEDDESLPNGFGCIVAKTEDESHLLVKYTNYDMNDLKSMADLAADGLKYQELRVKEKARREQKALEDAEIAQKVQHTITTITTVAPADTTVSNVDDVPNDMLPTGWATARDDEGNAYYFNETSLETTWDPPKMSSEEKDQKSIRLRKMIGHFISDVLLTYRDENAKNGKINSEDDYKYLIRRLSNGMMRRIIKELRTFRLTDEGRHMAAKYCHKYMTRQGECFIRRREPEHTPSTVAREVS